MPNPREEFAHHDEEATRELVDVYVKIYFLALQFSESLHTLTEKLGMPATEPKAALNVKAGFVTYKNGVMAPHIQVFLGEWRKVSSRTLRRIFQSLTEVERALFADDLLPEIQQQMERGVQSQRELEDLRLQLHRLYLDIMDGNLKVKVLWQPEELDVHGIGTKDIARWAIQTHGDVVL